MKQSDWSQSFHADKLNNKLYSCFMDPEGSLPCLQKHDARNIYFQSTPSTLPTFTSVTMFLVPWIKRFCRHLTAEALVKSQTIPNEICGRRNSNGTGSFSAYFGLSPVRIIQPSSIHIHLSITGGI
jgi:hypothetical protein